MKKIIKGPLNGVKVLDLTQYLSGPFCTMTMADLGAEVIKIERPNAPKGSGPFLNGERIYDLSVNRSKKSIILDLKSEGGKQVFKRLVEKTDVLVENFKPGTMQRLGLDYKELKKINPKIIYLAISGFGQTGPYSNRGAMDLVVQGMSGLMSLTGDPDGRPVKAGTSISDILSGLFGLTGIISALYNREKTGEGMFIDVAMLDSTFACLENAVINTCVFDENPKRIGNMHPTSVPFQTFKTIDGEVIITCSRDPAFYRLCDAMNRPDLKKDKRFSKSESRRQNRIELEKEIIAFTSKLTLDECEKILNEYDVPNGRINTMLMICDDPQIKEREMLVEVEHPIAGKYKMSGSPIKFNRFACNEYNAAPIPGEHTYEIVEELLGVGKEELDRILAEED